jgi:hypothetical protein
MHFCVSANNSLWTQEQQQKQKNGLFAATAVTESM